MFAGLRDTQKRARLLLIGTQTTYLLQKQLECVVEVRDRRDSNGLIFKSLSYKTTSDLRYATALMGHVHRAAA